MNAITEDRWERERFESHIPGAVNCLEAYFSPYKTEENEESLYRDICFDNFRIKYFVLLRFMITFVYDFLKESFKCVKGY